MLKINIVSELPVLYHKIFKIYLLIIKILLLTIHILEKIKDKSLESQIGNDYSLKKKLFSK